MSEEDVDIVRRVFEAYEREEVAGAIEMLDPDVRISISALWRG